MKTFQYPDEGPTKSTDPQPTGAAPAKASSGDGAYVKAFFNGVAVFKDGGFDPNSKLWCQCSCCEFRQYILYYKATAIGLTSDYFLHDEASGIEDCFWVAVTGPPGSEKISRTINAGASPEPWKEEGETKMYGPFCYGQTRPPPSAPGQTEGPTETFHGDCFYHMSDSPGFKNPLANGTTFSLEFKFLGVIHDTCNFWVPVAWSVVEFPRWSGTVLGDDVLEPATAEDK